MTDKFVGRRVLVVEDDYFIASEVASTLEGGGATILGPVGNVEDAMRAIGGNDVDAVVLDINLRGEMAFAVADALLSMNIPFVFATGYDRSVIPERYGNVPRCLKPVSYVALASALRGGSVQPSEVASSALTSSGAAEGAGGSRPAASIGSA
jgi:DNA-binding LytR/AlgR family response regulator